MLLKTLAAFNNKLPVAATCMVLYGYTLIISAALHLLKATPVTIH